MAISKSVSVFGTEVVSLLAEIREVRARVMCGGHGLYCKTTFFRLIEYDRLYFNVDDDSRGDDIAFGMQSFSASLDRVIQSYYGVLWDVFASDEQLVRRARRTIDVTGAIAFFKVGGTSSLRAQAHQA